MGPHFENEIHVEGKKKLFSLEKTSKKATKKSVQKKRKRTAKEDSDDSSNGDFK
jgi:hypothetical protein